MQKKRGSYSPSIYALVDPRDDVVRYVGFSKFPRRRLRFHLKRRNSSRRLSAWVMELQRLGKQPRMIILERVAEHEWEAIEKRWIAHYRSEPYGSLLLNVLDGGDGNPYKARPRKLQIKRQRYKFAKRLYAARKQERIMSPEFLGGPKYFPKSPIVDKCPDD